MNEHDTPNLDLWWAGSRNRTDRPQVVVTCPEYLNAYQEDGWEHSSVRFARLDLGGVIFRDDIKRLRLMVAAAAEALDMIDVEVKS